MNVVLHCGHLGFQKCCCCSKYFVNTFWSLSLEPVCAPGSIPQRTLGSQTPSMSATGDIGFKIT